MIKEIAYKVIDFFTFGKGLKKTFNNAHTVRLPTRYVNYFPKDYENENFDFIKSWVSEGGVVLDIGAHIGLFSLIASQIVGQKGKVFSFEPSPTTFKVLQKAISINKANHIIEPVQKAVGENEGTIQFYVSNDDIDNSNSLVKYLSDRELKEIDIAITSTDLFTEEKKLTQIDFIKIDVEGAELDTLKGAKNTLLTYKPFCMIGIHPEAILAKGDNLLDIYNIIKECGYKILVNNKEISKESFLANKELIDLHLIPQ